MEYIGEHLIAGKIGHFSLTAAFSFALFAFIAFVMSRKNADWNKSAKTAFYLHCIFALTAIGTLFYLFLINAFEYHYIWAHSNKAMPLRYIFSSFWGGQEGSFLLWIFWHVVVGFALFKSTRKEWRPWIMAVFMAVQCGILLMLLGIKLGGMDIGINPFTVLMRNHEEFRNLPVFMNPRYLENLDGKGLNPLLQNYWMTIHPPTLFLGFALTLVPFCYAISGLWRKNLTEWIKPCIPWGLMGIGILGAGILMGGAWAYEALSFGGFWAWDPVENASLVPWLILVAGTHMLYLPHQKKTSLILAIVLNAMAFILVFYSTYLTRSGVLSETSVHSFTESGLEVLLIGFLTVCLSTLVYLLITRWKLLPKENSEDPLLSREFWMLIGAFILMISAIQITSSTSIPVFNKAFGSNIAPPENAIDHFNAWQIPIAILLSFLIGFSQLLKFKSTTWAYFWEKSRLSLIITAAFIGCCIALSHFDWISLLLLGTSTFAITGNAYYFIKILKGKIKKAGGSIAHVGFGLILLGALIANGKKDIISNNMTSIDIAGFGDGFHNNENTVLFLNDTVKMGDYYISYRGRKKEGINLFYQIDYMKNTHNAYQNQFSLFPRVQMNSNMGNVSEPDTKHFWNKDIYTHITYAEMEDRLIDPQGYLKPITHKFQIGDTLKYGKYYIVLNHFNQAINNQSLNLQENDLAVAANISIGVENQMLETLNPVFIMQDMKTPASIPEESKKLGLKLDFIRPHPKEDKIEIAIYEKNEKAKEFVVMQAILFPGINILWAGCILMVLGTLIAIKNRVSQK